MSNDIRSLIHSPHPAIDVYILTVLLRYHLFFCLIFIKKLIHGQAQWLTLIIPALWETKVGRSPEVRSSWQTWPTWLNHISTKNTKISWAWWGPPVVPDTGEAEAGELLGPRRQRLWWAEIAPLHSSLCNKTETPSQKEKQQQKKKKRKLGECGGACL